MQSRDSLAEEVEPTSSTAYFTPGLSVDGSNSSGPASAGGAGGPFNFQPMSMAKSPVIKSVRQLLPVPMHEACTEC